MSVEKVTRSALLQPEAQTQALAELTENNFWADFGRSYKELGLNLHLALPHFPTSLVLRQVRLALAADDRDSPRSPFSSWDEYLDEIYAFSPRQEEVGAIEVQESWGDYFIELSEYAQKLGIRLIPPFLYVAAQGYLATLAYKNDWDLDRLSLPGVTGLLLTAHLFNLVATYRLLRQGGEPVNAVAFGLSEIMEKKGDFSSSTALAATTLVVGKIVFLELSKLLGGGFLPDEYKTAALTVTTAMLLEGSLNLLMGVNAGPTEDSQTEGEV